MRQYEIVFILDDQSFTDSGDNFIAKEVTELIDELGGGIITAEKMGRRHLAYPIKKRAAGVYWDLTVRLNADKVEPFQAKYRLDLRVLRLAVMIDERPAPVKNAAPAEPVEA